MFEFVQEEAHFLGIFSFPLLAMGLKSALLVDHGWCKKIFHSKKTWEIRNKACTKRGRVGIACSARTSPTGKALLLGEVTITDCLVVARNVRGFVSAPEVMDNYMFLEENIPKHQVFTVKDFPILSNYKTVFAWVLSDPCEYAAPKELVAKQGCVVWANL